MAGIDPARVLALSLATQGGTLVPTDLTGNPLRDAIVWNDARCQEERKRLDPDYVWRTTGWTLGQGLNLLQLIWLRENEPELFHRAARFVSVPDYLSLHLAGECVIDPSNAGINQLADIGQNSRRPAMRCKPEVIAYVREKLLLSWSPEQISGRLALEYADDPQMRVSFATIYRWLHRGLLPQSVQLSTHLRHHGHRHNEQRGKKVGARELKTRCKDALRRKRLGD